MEGKPGTSEAQGLVPLESLPCVRHAAVGHLFVLQVFKTPEVDTILILQVKKNPSNRKPELLA